MRSESHRRPLMQRLHLPSRTQWASLLALLLLAGAAALLVHRGRSIDWSAVLAALRHTPLLTLVAAMAAGAASHGLIAAYDVLAVRSLRLRVSPLQALGVGLIAYPLTLNLGALVGGVGFRWKLYSERGVSVMDVGRIVVFTTLANWVGYAVLSGVVLCAGVLELPKPLALPAGAQHLLGAALIALGALYVAACAWSPVRRVEWRGHGFELPRGGMALAQIAVSSLHWALMGATAWILMPRGLPYLQVLGTMLTGAVASAMVHVPGGLGVIEGVFVAMLGDRVHEGPLVAAVLAFRAAFYLLPLAGAALLYGVLRWTAARRPRERGATP